MAKAQDKATQTAGRGQLEDFAREMIFPLGSTNDAYAQYFTGQSYLAPVSTEQVHISNVTFEPRCRNNRHISNEWLEPVGDDLYDALEAEQ